MIDFVIFKRDSGSGCVSDCNGKPTARNERGLAMKSAA